MDEANEVLTLVKDAQSKGKFNLAEVVKGRGFPEDVIDIYLDVESAYELSKLNSELVTITDLDEAAPLEARAAELADKIVKSKLTFHLRGVSQKVVEIIEAKAKADRSDEDDNYILEYFSRLIAASIVKVVDADGNEDDHVFEFGEIDELRGMLPSESWERLVATVQKLTLASGYFRGLTDAGFLPKS